MCGSGYIGLPLTFSCIHFYLSDHRPFDIESEKVSEKRLSEIRCGHWLAWSANRSDDRSTTAREYSRTGETGKMLVRKMSQKVEPHLRWNEDAAALGLASRHGRRKTSALPRPPSSMLRQRCS
jgi:hypothetical protein